jgi:predicted nucleotidyltransferase component of viral defense system
LDEDLIFKGGTALKRCYFHDYRFSEDLDFTLARAMSFADILSGLEDVYKQVIKESGIKFSFHAETEAGITTVIRFTLAMKAHSRQQPAKQSRWISLSRKS